MAVTLRKSLVLKIKKNKNQQNFYGLKTYMYICNFNARLVVFRSNFIKIMFFF